MSSVQGAMAMINVLLVTTWKTSCGIAEHSALLREAVEAADPDIRMHPWESLDPASLLYAKPRPFDPVNCPILHLNYQAALHSRWTPAKIDFARVQGFKILVTYHDTGVPNSDQ